MIDARSLRGDIEAAMREAANADDHFYGAWSGGSKASGGGPAGSKESAGKPEEHPGATRQLEPQTAAGDEFGVIRTTVATGSVVEKGFVPATSNQEIAHRLRATGLFGDTYPFSDLPMDQRNLVLANAEHLSHLGFTHKVRMVDTDSTDPNLNGRSTAAGIMLNPTGDWGGGYSGAKNIGDTFRHEYGHNIIPPLKVNPMADDIGHWVDQHVGNRPDDWIASHLSKYAVTGGGNEMWAETFRTVTTPGYRMGTIPGDRFLFKLLRKHGVMKP